MLLLGQPRLHWACQTNTFLGLAAKLHNTVSVSVYLEYTIQDNMLVGFVDCRGHIDVISLVWPLQQRFHLPSAYLSLSLSQSGICKLVARQTLYHKYTNLEMLCLPCAGFFFATLQT